MSYFAQTMKLPSCDSRTQKVSVRTSWTTLPSWYFRNPEFMMTSQQSNFTMQVNAARGSSKYTDVSASVLGS